MPATFTATVPSSGVEVDLTFSTSVTGLVASDFQVVSGGVVMTLETVTGSGTAWVLPLTRRSGWIPSGQTVKVSYLGADVAITKATATATNSSSYTQAQQRFVDRGMGMFVHFSSATYYGDPITLAQVQTIDMIGYDMEQWFTTVIVPSGVRYAVFTTKHAGGYSWWPTAAGNFNISQTAFGVAHPGADLVRDWVRLCRKYNIGVGLYLNWYDTWWTSQRPGADGGYTNPAYITYMNQQITELFSNYGKIDLLWIDSMQYHVGYGSYPPSNVIGLRDSLQPACMIVNNSHTHDLTYTDIQVEEGSGGGGSIPASSNTKPTEFCEDSGTDNLWVWSAPNENHFQDVYTIAAKMSQCRTARTAYLPNFPVNTSGLMPTVTGTYIATLAPIIGKQGANPVVPPLVNVRSGTDRGDGQTGQWGGGINSSAILGVL